MTLQRHIPNSSQSAFEHTLLWLPGSGDLSGFTCISRGLQPSWPSFPARNCPLPIVRQKVPALPLPCPSFYYLASKSKANWSLENAKASKSKVRVSADLTMNRSSAESGVASQRHSTVGIHHHPFGDLPTTLSAGARDGRRSQITVQYNFRRDKSSNFGSLRGLMDMASVS